LHLNKRTRSLFVFALKILVLKTGRLEKLRFSTDLILALKDSLRARISSFQ